MATQCVLLSHMLKSHWVICKQLHSPPPARAPHSPTPLPSPSPILHSASRPAIVWESIGKLSLLPVFLPHQRQVAPCPPGGGKCVGVCV